MKNETLTALYQRLVLDTVGTEAHDESKALYFEIKRAIVEASNHPQAPKGRGFEGLARRESQREPTP